MSIQDTISEMSDDDAIAAADALISEWIADQLMGDDVTSGGDSQVAALRQRATQYQDFLAPDDMKVIAGAARQALGFLSESFGKNTSVGATLLDVIESPTVSTDQHGAGKFILCVGFSIALILAVAKIGGTVELTGIKINIESGVPDGTGDLLLPITDAIKYAIDLAEKKIKSEEKPNKADEK